MVKDVTNTQYKRIVNLRKLGIPAKRVKKIVLKKKIKRKR